MKALLTLVLVAGLSVGQAATFTVSFTGNPGADYANLQTAIDDAIAIGGAHDILIESGQSFNTNLSITISNGSELTVSGGWNSTFDSQTSGAFNTILFAGADASSLGTDRVMTIMLTNGELSLENLSVQRGSGVSFGAGILASVDNQAELHLDQISMINNQAIGANSVAGGGLDVSAEGNSRVEIDDTTFSNNTVESTSGSVTGAGLSVFTRDMATFSMVDSSIARNSSIANGNQATGVGIYLQAEGSSEIEFSNNFVSQNQVQEATGAVGVNAAFWLFNDAVAVIGSNDIQLATNLDSDLMTSGMAQVSLISSADTNLWFANNFVHNAETSGVDADTRNTSVTTIINNTFYDHAGQSLAFSGAGTGRLGNTIMALDNGFNFIAGSIDQVANSTLDPQLLDDDEPMIADHSPARDAGNNNPWPGALPMFDFYGENRIGNTGIVDIGAAEVQIGPEIPIFADGFESPEQD